MIDRLPWIDSPVVGFPLRVVEGFVEHRGLVRAASLSYTTLFALVPLLAVVLSVSKVFLRNQDPEFLETRIDQFLEYAIPQLQVMGAADTAAAREDVFEQIREAIERVNAGALGTFGAITLAAVGITLLSAIEAALNNVWGLAENRRITQRVLYYWAGVTLGPMLLFFSLSLTSSGVVAGILGTLPGSLVSATFRFIVPFVVLGAGFTMLYKAMPNTAVPLRAALCGGFTAGALFQLNNLMSAAYFSQVAYYGQIYGSLGAIPIIMIGLYLAWAIVLIGAEVAYASATWTTEEAPVRYPESFEERSILALEVACVSAAGYLEGRGGASIAEIAERLSIPIEWVNRTTWPLVRAGLLTAAGDGDEPPSRYLPARPPGAIPALAIVESVRGDGALTGDREPSAAVKDLLSRRASAERETLSAVTLEDLARKDTA